ncbi:glycosyltransferase involved in cell wall biosynthesis [Kribbella rubisoli]|uniref:Glycosyltransferase involved in cell wall biosynthesis n=1 Tax=Kribbella rubisoli TaxID=3075929 RepID=A0A4Q7VZB5_9ACTN|nr:glycosyltransferase family 4 protein [Kribbella rubisoli]RZU01769.1 glycosyltransferase involved in cell wall biosynthesis [Kribbella rubisoli]
MHVPRIVMIVANDITNDTRVLKEAVALGKAGYQVTLLGVSASGRLAIDTIPSGQSGQSDVVMIRVPGHFVLRDERNRRHRLRRGRRLFDIRPEGTEEARVAARLADLKAERGRATARREAGQVGGAAHLGGAVSRSLRHRRLRLSQAAVSVRTWFGETEAGIATSFWQWWDTWLPGRSALVRWRSTIPEADDYEAIFADLIDQLRPDALHAHDMHVIAVGSRAAGRADLRGRSLKVVYDAHEYVPGLSQYGGRTPRMIAAWAQHEAEYIRTVDRVVTVSPAIARTLHKRHKLDREPTVVINSPELCERDSGITDIRATIGLAADVPLLVYSGGVTRARGVETAMEALPLLPGVHLAVVCVPHARTRPVDELRALGKSLQIEDRVHYLDPVAPNDVIHFLRTADVGLIPILRYPSHEMALPNKVFEYTFAGLPVVTSDMPTLEEFVGKTGIGEVFEAENPDALAVAVKTVLKDPELYRERAADPGLRAEMSWEAQAGHLRDLYAELVGAPPAHEDVVPRLVLGPIGSKAAKAWFQDLDGAEIPRRPLTLPELDSVTHVLMEDWQSVLGGEDLIADLPLLTAARIKHAVVVYGRVDRQDVRRRMRAYNGTVFVTDRVIADAVEGTIWLPPADEGAKVLRDFMTE